jgi:ring-1,2-phenylacetyl-CoA epoxidase subunit PaaA
VHNDRSLRWKVKRFTNDELRQKFVDTTVPQAHFLGLTIPDDDLSYDGEHWRFGEPDGAEFKRVLKGDGPCNRERLAARNKAHDDGAWVREAAVAHAEKRARRGA